MILCAEKLLMLDHICPSNLKMYFSRSVLQKLLQNTRPAIHCTASSFSTDVYLTVAATTDVDWSPHFLWELDYGVRKFRTLQAHTPALKNLDS